MKVHSLIFVSAVNAMVSSQLNEHASSAAPWSHFNLPSSFVNGCADYMVPDATVATVTNSRDVKFVFH